MLLMTTIITNTKFKKNHYDNRKKVLKINLQYKIQEKIKKGIVKNYSLMEE